MNIIAWIVIYFHFLSRLVTERSWLPFISILFITGAIFFTAYSGIVWFIGFIRLIIDLF